MHLWVFVSVRMSDGLISVLLVIFKLMVKKTGKYILGGEELVLNSKNESIISYADYALAMVDEIEKGEHIQERISVVRA